jgi:hypothetical protein
LFNENLIDASLLATLVTRKSDHFIRNLLEYNKAVLYLCAPPQKTIEYRGYLTYCTFPFFGRGKVRARILFSVLSNQCGEYLIYAIASTNTNCYKRNAMAASKILSTLC